MEIFLQLLVSGILIGGVYAVISVGVTLIFGVIRIVNFAQGEFIMLAMYAAFWLHELWGIDPYASTVIVVPTFFCLGLLTERVLIAPILRAPHAMQIFATFGLSVILQNLALVLWKADFRSVNPEYASAAWVMGPVSVPVTSLAAFGVALVMYGALFVFLKYTMIGKALRGIAQNRYASSLMGVNVPRLSALAFGVGIASAAMAGVLLVPMYYTFPRVGVDLILTGFVVVVLGGLGSVPGALMGGLVIGITQTLSGYFVSVELKDAITLVLFIVILLVRPQGIFGQVGSEEMGFK